MAQIPGEKALSAAFVLKHVALLTQLSLQVGALVTRMTSLGHPVSPDGRGRQIGDVVLRWQVEFSDQQLPSAIP